MSGGEFGGDVTLHAGYSDGPERLRSFPEQKQGDPLIEHDIVGPDAGLASLLNKPFAERRELLEVIDEAREAHEIAPIDVVMRHPTAHDRSWL